MQAEAGEQMEATESAPATPEDFAADAHAERPSPSNDRDRIARRSLQQDFAGLDVHLQSTTDRHWRGHLDGGHSPTVIDGRGIAPTVAVGGESRARTRFRSPSAATDIDRHIRRATPAAFDAFNPATEASSEEQLRPFSFTADSAYRDALSRALCTSPHSGTPRLLSLGGARTPPAARLPQGSAFDEAVRYDRQAYCRLQQRVRRHIPHTPERILDAPELLDDFVRSRRPLRRPAAHCAAPLPHARCPTASRPLRCPAAPRPLRCPTAPRPLRCPTAPRPLRCPTAPNPLRSPTAPHVPPTSATHTYTASPPAAKPVPPGPLPQRLSHLRTLSVLASTRPALWRAVPQSARLVVGQPPRRSSWRVGLLVACDRRCHLPIAAADRGVGTRHLDRLYAGRRIQCVPPRRCPV